MSAPLWDFKVGDLELQVRAKSLQEAAAYLARTLPNSDVDFASLKLATEAEAKP